MSEPASEHDIFVARLMRQLYGFAQGLGVNEFDLRVITDMPLMPDEDRLARARNWMLIASA